PMRESHSTAPHHAATALHTHSLHDALPIFSQLREVPQQARPEVMALLGMELDAVHVAVAHRRAEVGAVRGYRAYVLRLGALGEEGVQEVEAGIQVELAEQAGRGGRADVVAPH